MSILIELKKTNEIAEYEYRQIVNLITDGGQISDEVSLISRVTNGEMIALAYNDIGDIIALAELKKPTSSYAHRVVYSSGTNNINYELLKYELGYFVTHPDYRRRGLCAKLVNRLIAYFDEAYNGHFLFATTAHSHIIRLLESHGFKIFGSDYPSSANRDNRITFLVRRNANPPFLSGDNTYNDILDCELSNDMLNENFLREYDNPTDRKCQLCLNPYVAYNAHKTVYMGNESIQLCSYCLAHLLNDCEMEYYVCEHCNDVHLSDEDFYSLNEDVYCEDCFNHIAVMCESCSTHLHRNNTHEIENCIYCEDCYSNADSTVCYSCDEAFFFVNMYYDDNTDEYYCSSCYNELSSRDNSSYNTRAVMGYHDSITHRFYHDENKDTSLYMGIELEVECPSGVKVNYVADIFNERFEKLTKKANHLFYMEDGSLSNGFEIISHPMTYKYHIKHFRWDIALDILRELKCTSHDSNTCGLHVHLSRDYFSPTDEVKIGLFVYTQKKLLQDICRRGYTSYCRDKHFDNPNDVTKVENRYDSRYEAVNYTNRNTIEIRQCKGTLNESSFYAYLEFVDSLVNFIKLNSLTLISDVENCLAKYLEYISNRSKRYARLIKFLSSRGYEIVNNNNSEMGEK